MSKQCGKNCPKLPEQFLGSFGQSHACFSCTCRQPFNTEIYCQLLIYSKGLEAWHYHFNANVPLGIGSRSMNTSQKLRHFGYFLYHSVQRWTMRLHSTKSQDKAATVFLDNANEVEPVTMVCRINWTMLRSSLISPCIIGSGCNPFTGQITKQNISLSRHYKDKNGFVLLHLVQERQYVLISCAKCNKATPTKLKI